MKFKEGDMVRVLPKKRGWEDEGQYYVQPMEDKEGDVFCIGLDGDLGAIYIKYAGYMWHEDWLAPASMENE